MLSVYLLSQAGLLESFQMPLQVGGLAARAAGPDHQVAPVLEEQGDQGGVAAFVEGRDALVGGEFGGRRGAEVEGDAAEEGLVIADVFGAEGVVGFLAQRGEGGGVALLGIGGDVAVVLEIGGAGEDQGGGVGAVDDRRWSFTLTLPPRRAPAGGLRSGWRYRRAGQ